MTFVGLGLGLAFVLFLFTKPGQIVVALFLGAAVFGAAVYGLGALVAPHPMLGATIGFSVLGFMVCSWLFQATRAFIRVMRDRRERAKRLWALEHPLDGELLPPQRHLSP